MSFLFYFTLLHFYFVSHYSQYKLLFLKDYKYNQTTIYLFLAIKFLSETGPGEIPVHCLIRRSAPRVEVSILDFGKMIIGECEVLSLNEYDFSSFIYQF